MIKDIYKYKIPQDCAYVAKTSRIESWIEREGIITDVRLDYGALLNEYVFSADFYLPCIGMPYERLQIEIGKVKKEMVGTIRERIESEVFPVLTVWVKHIEALDKTSTAYKDRRFMVQWNGRSIVITKD